MFVCVAADYACYVVVDSAIIGELLIESEYQPIDLLAISEPEYLNTEWFKWRKQEPTELRRMAYQDQLPPHGLNTGKSIIPRARAHLPSGIRFREAKPDAATG